MLQCKRGETRGSTFALGNEKVHISETRILLYCVFHSVLYLVNLSSPYIISELFFVDIIFSTQLNMCQEKCPTQRHTPIA